MSGGKEEYKHTLPVETINFLFKQRASLKISFLSFFVVAITIASFPTTSNAQSPFTATLAEIFNNPAIGFTTIDAIEWNDSDLVICGTVGKKIVVENKLIRDICSYIRTNDNDPECIIRHTQQEFDALADFHEKFIKKAEGTSGVKLVLDWEKSNFKQYIQINNIERNSRFAGMLFQADYLLKKMVMGKKKIPAKKSVSYTNFIAHHMNAKIAQGGFSSYPRETMFYLYPQKITVAKGARKLRIEKVDFILQPCETYEAIKNHSAFSKSIPNDWADTFSKNFETIAEKSRELKTLKEAYKLYALMRMASTYATGHFSKDRSGCRAAHAVPDSIPAFTYAELNDNLQQSAQRPGNYVYKFQWIMLAGGIIFKSPGEETGVIVEETTR